MARRLTAKERRERAATLAALVLQSRSTWFGHCVKFVHPLDGKVKLGRVVEVADDGITKVEYQLIPGTDDILGEMYIVVGHELEVLTLVDSVRN